MVVRQPLSISLGLVLLASSCAPSLRWVRANTTDETKKTRSRPARSTRKAAFPSAATR